MDDASCPQYTSSFIPPGSDSAHPSASLLLSRHFTCTPSLLVLPIDSHSFAQSSAQLHTASVYNILSSWLSSSHTLLDLPRLLCLPACPSHSTRSTDQLLALISNALILPGPPTSHPPHYALSSRIGAFFFAIARYTLANPAPKNQRVPYPSITTHVRCPEIIPTSELATAALVDQVSPEMARGTPEDPDTMGGPGRIFRPSIHPDAPSQTQNHADPHPALLDLFSQ